MVVVGGRIILCLVGVDALRMDPFSPSYNSSFPDPKTAHGTDASSNKFSMFSSGPLNPTALGLLNPENDEKYNDSLDSGRFLTFQPIGTLSNSDTSSTSSGPSPDPEQAGKVSKGLSSIRV